MDKKRLPQIGDICYITFRVSETETTEDLGYLDISQVEDEVEDGFIDEYGNYFEYFFHIPAIDKHFEINQLVSWRDINGWISVDDRLPEITDHKGFMRSDVVLGFGKEDEYETVPTYSLVYVISGSRFYSENGECYQITHWQPLPPIPTK